MVRQVTAGPAELVLMASVARSHYVEGRAKTEIAQQFGISRFKVARLLELARDTGLVRIEIDRPGALDIALSAATSAAATAATGARAAGQRQRAHGRQHHGHREPSG